ncbi:MAG: DegT/DnrJ/EryC1/StrS family aminotransferase [Deltaproteobacteria bacterium]|nr:DegT/DnrJ/EryC1/StrS family aminotransferase [Deltaproteobacteria bacterium]
MKKFVDPIYVTRPLLPDKTELFEAIEMILNSKQLTNMGKFHEDLEKELARFLGVDNLVLFVNGTIALLAALKALDLPAGSEVITTPFTFPATPHVIPWNNLRPVFADIEPDTFTLKPDAIERSITADTSALLPVHVYGFPCRVEDIDDIADRHRLRVVYDGAHAFSTELDGKSICTRGDITAHSFHATKLFNTLEGGALAFGDKNLKQRILDLRNFGIRNEHEVDYIGINGKMNEIQAAFGLLNLKHVRAEQQARAVLHARYKEELGDLEALRIPDFPERTTNALQYFPVLVKRTKQCSRDVLYDKLRERNIIARKYFFPLCSNITPYRDLPSAAPENLPVANRIANQVLCLPFFGGLGPEKVGILCEIIREIVGG